MVALSEKVLAKLDPGSKLCETLKAAEPNYAINGVFAYVKTLPIEKAPDAETRDRNANANIAAWLEVTAAKNCLQDMGRGTPGDRADAYQHPRNHDGPTIYEVASGTAAQVSEFLKCEGVDYAGFSADIPSAREALKSPGLRGQRPDGKREL